MNHLPVSLGDFQAQRSIDAEPFADQEYEQPAHQFLASLHPDDPDLHTQHVIPGAKRAVTHAELKAWQQQGLSEHDMVEHVNARWDAVNHRRQADFDVWRNGEHRVQVEGHQARVAARAQALAELERRLLGDD